MGAEQSFYPHMRIEHYEDGQVEYEILYEKDLSKGYGKRYYKEGGLMYEGEYNDLEYHGLGVSYYGNGQVCYDGNYYFGRYSGDIYNRFYNRDGILLSYGSIMPDSKKTVRTGYRFYRPDLLISPGDKFGSISKEELDGKGICILQDATILCGIWHDGQYIKELSLDDFMDAQRKLESKLVEESTAREKELAENGNKKKEQMELACKLKYERIEKMRAEKEEQMELACKFKCELELIEKARAEKKEQEKKEQKEEEQDREPGWESVQEGEIKPKNE